MILAQPRDISLDERGDSKQAAKPQIREDA